MLEKGITAAEGENVVLAAVPDLALRIGRRRDPHPVLLTVNVEQALSHGIALHRFGELLYLADAIPSGCFTGPPLPKEKPAAAKPAVEPERASRHEAGTFVLDPSRFDPARKHREQDWKKERRQQRKHKDKW